jgi:hypothetical protein
MQMNTVTKLFEAWPFKVVSIDCCLKVIFQLNCELIAVGKFQSVLYEMDKILSYNLTLLI